MLIRLTLSAIVALLCLSLMQADAAQALQQERCTTTLSPGQSIGEAVRRSTANAVICLASGIYGPVVVQRDAPAGVTVRSTAEGVNIAGTRSQPAVSVEAERFTLAGVVVREGTPVTVRAVRAGRLTLRDVEVEGAGIGILLNGTTDARLEDVTVNAPIDAGLVAAGGATVTAERLSVTGGGIGVAALPEGTRLTLRGGRIEGSDGPAIFAGALGCADVTVGTAVVPDCYYENAAGYISDVRLTIEGTTVDDGPGAGVVLFPGVRAEIRGVGIYGRERGGLLAWGAEVAVAGSTVEANWEYGIAARAFPHAGAEGFPRGSVRVTGTTVRSTRALSERVGGSGVVARGSQLVLRDSKLVWNEAAGVVAVEGATGEVRNSEFIENRGAAMCRSADSTVTEEGNRLSGNRPNAVITCVGAGGGFG